MSNNSQNDRGALIDVAMWIVLVSSVLAVTGKLYTKWSATKRLMADDYFSVLALLLTVVQSIAVDQQVKFGLGDTSDDLAHAKTENQLKARYAASIFYIISVYITKLITLFFFIHIAVTNTGRQVVRALTLFIIVWVMVLSITVIFQCRLPTPWDIQNGACVDMDVLGAFHLVVDVCTQVLISFLPFYLLHTLSINRKSKQWATMLAFTPNIATVPLAVLRYIYLRQALSSSDVVQGAYNEVLIETLHTLIGVTAACVPFTKPIVDSIVSEAHLIINESGGQTSIGYPSGMFGGQTFSSQSYTSKKHSIRVSTRVSTSVSRPFDDEIPGTRSKANEAIMLGNISTVSAKAHGTGEAIIEEQFPEDDRDGSLERIIVAE